VNALRCRQPELHGCCRLRRRFRTYLQTADYNTRALSRRHHSWCHQFKRTTVSRADLPAPVVEVYCRTLAFTCDCSIHAAAVRIPDLLNCGTLSRTTCLRKYPVSPTPIPGSADAARARLVLYYDATNISRAGLPNSTFQPPATFRYACLCSLVLRHLWYSVLLQIKPFWRMYARCLVLSCGRLSATSGCA